MSLGRQLWGTRGVPPTPASWLLPAPPLPPSPSAPASRLLLSAPHHFPETGPLVLPCAPRGRLTPLAALLYFGATFAMD